MPVIKHIYNLYNIIILITTVGGEVIFLWNKIMCHTIYSLLSYSKVIHAVQWVTLHNIQAYFLGRCGSLIVHAPYGGHVPSLLSLTVLKFMVYQYSGYDAYCLASCSTVLSTESVNSQKQVSVHLAHCLHHILHVYLMLEGFTLLQYQLRQYKRAGNCKDILKLTKKQWIQCLYTLTLLTCSCSIFMVCALYLAHTCSSHDKGKEQCLLLLYCA